MCLSHRCPDTSEQVSGHSWLSDPVTSGFLALGTHILELRGRRNRTWKEHGRVRNSGLGRPARRGDEGLGQNGEQNAGCHTSMGHIRDRGTAWPVHGGTESHRVRGCLALPKTLDGP